MISATEAAQIATLAAQLIQTPAPVDFRIVLPDTNSLSTVIAAWVGAIGTIGLTILEFHKFSNDKPRLRVKTTQGFFVPPTEILVFIEVANIGNKAIKLSGAGFDLSDGNQMIITRSMIIQFPFELNAGDSCSVEIEKDDLIRDLERKGVKLKRAWYRDATGKKHYGKINKNILIR